jgi:hypothetical protein
VDADAGANYHGREAWLAAYGIAIFFALRAAGRFLGAWMLLESRWQSAIAVLSGAILACFAVSVAGGVDWAVYLLPASGLFMAVIYPTLKLERDQLHPGRARRSRRRHPLFHVRVRGRRAARHGRIERRHRQIAYGFWLATGLAALLFAGLLVNWLANPRAAGLAEVDVTD